MWNSIFLAVSSAVSSAWVWFDGLFDAIPGAWEFIFVVILIFLIVKHVLAPLTGTVIYSGVSDAVNARREKYQLDHPGNKTAAIKRENRLKRKQYG